jgi:hypothetical protein
VVAQTYNPTYSRGGDREDPGLRLVQVKSLQDPISTNKRLGTVVCTCIYTEIINKRITIQTGPGINATPYLKKYLK